MIRKNSKINGSVEWILDALGLGRKRGGAGSVACALAVALLFIGVAFTVAAGPSNSDSSYADEPQMPTDDIGEPSWEPPVKPVPEPVSGTGSPVRIPV